MKSQTQIFSFNFLVLLALTFFTSLNQSQAQSSGTLEVGQNKVFTVDKDTLILDAIVIGDSAKIILAKPTTYFKANQMIVGSGSQIIGIGAKGENGKVGKSFTTALGICKSGVNGEAGGQGIDGGAGKNLVIEVAQLTIKSTLTIELTGGNGGDGGKGGKGSHGGGTTVHCTANGGNGGSGGNGGNGGIGGTFSLIVQTPAKADLTSKINLINRGGYRGIGGDGGQGGHRGTGPSERKSSIGLAGKIGTDGKYGQDGRLLFYSIFKPGEISATTTARSVSGK